eukprot:TRINITY_DN8833_c0_g1_i3.p1 TRINITY_DN8833_c0_g1~~TRINITY_DN8833_c0_g1_i3.p1  ORF type:complete len:463 (-),score=108.49 TRINITY_DN8833_c0_g1_i3:210-1598(-)
MAVFAELENPDVARRLCELVDTKGGVVDDALAALTADFPKTAAKRCLAKLREEESQQGQVMARLVRVAEWHAAAPLLLLCCDSAGEFFVLAVSKAELASLDKDVESGRTILHARDAQFKDVTVDSCRFPCAAVAHPDDVSALGGGPLCSEAPRLAKAANTDAGGICLPPEEGQMPLEVKGRVVKALLGGLGPLVDERLGPGAGAKIDRVRSMFERMGKGEIVDRDTPEKGQLYSTGYVEGLFPDTPFQDPRELPWTTELQKQWQTLRDELHAVKAAEEALWRSAANEEASKYYAPTNTEGDRWRVAGVLMSDEWVGAQRFPKTKAIVEQLKGVRVFECFYARMPPHSKLDPHSDNLNYQMTLHLALDCEHGKCAFRVGNQEIEWKEGEALVANTAYVHSCRNDSDRERLILCLRFWHPGLSEEEYLALKLAGAILASATGGNKQEAKPKPFAQRQEATKAAF